MWDEFFFLPFNLGEVVIGEFAPLRFDVTFDLIPLSFQYFGIHVDLLSAKIVYYRRTHFF